MNFPICANELIHYDIKDEHRLIISTDNFMALLEAGQSLSDELTLVFTKNGKPLIASTTSKDKLVDIKMILSTIREETLKKNRKLPEAQSYRELVVSYIENREKKKRDRDEIVNPRGNLSDTEMNRVCSPTIDSDTLQNVSVGAPKKQQSQHNLQPVIANEIVLSNNKRVKVTGNCTQEDLNTVSSILEDLENFEPEDDDVKMDKTQNESGDLIFGCLDNLKFPHHRATSAKQVNSAVVSKSASVKRVQLTNEEHESQIIIEESDKIPERNISDSMANNPDIESTTPRFHLSAMNFASEDIEMAPALAAKKSKSTTNSQIKQQQLMLKAQRKKKDAQVKNLFQDTQYSSDSAAILIENSDSESE